MTIQKSKSDPTICIRIPKKKKKKKKHRSYHHQFVKEANAGLINKKYIYKNIIIEE